MFTFLALKLIHIKKFKIIPSWCYRLCIYLHFNAIHTPKVERSSTHGRYLMIRRIFTTIQKDLFIILELCSTTNCSPTFYFGYSHHWYPSHHLGMTHLNRLPLLPSLIVKVFLGIYFSWWQAPILGRLHSVSHPVVITLSLLFLYSLSYT